MKASLFIILVITGIQVYSQNAILTMKDGTKKDVAIQATSSNTIFYTSGSSKFNELTSVEFPYRAGTDEGFYTKLSQAGVKTVFGKDDNPIVELQYDAGSTFFKR